MHIYIYPTIIAEILLYSNYIKTFHQVIKAQRSTYRAILSCRNDSGISQKIYKACIYSSCNSSCFIEWWKMVITPELLPGYRVPGVPRMPLFRSRGTTLPGHTVVETEL